jgi:hypothetical protein
MKKLLVITILLFTVTITAQVEETVPKALTLSEQIYSDVKGSLQGLGEALEVGASHVYKFLIRQQMIIAVTHTLFGLFGFLAFINWFKSYNDEKEIWFTADVKEGRPDDPSGIMLVRLLQLIVALILIIVSISNLDLIITGFLNPEYGAMKEILTIIK